ncbi:uncharacterized protein LOC135847378 isoform X2 [Planococcus citri]|uniref:uncharacterized protein LOC135847378 isoform X2 n=1 Tax=Planococcus citri TaxID=170843 RepID=UPI0031F8C683
MENWIVANCQFQDLENYFQPSSHIIVASVQETIINATFMPPEAYEFEISEAATVILEARSFSKLNYLQKVTFRNVDNLIIKKDAFSNLVVPQFFLEIKDCNRVEIESKAFYLSRGPVAVSITKCNSLIYHREAIAWISEANVKDVKTALFAENSFSQNSEKVTSHHGYSTKIIIGKTSLPHLPENMFSSPAAIIKLLNCDVKVVKKNAFSALEIYSVQIENTTLDVISSGAFSDRSLLTSLQFADVNICRISTGAIHSAVTNFTFYNSKVETVEKEAFNMSTMYSVHFLNNVFEHVEERGITLKDWRKAIIENNTLRNLENEAINVPYSDELTKQQAEFHFVGNILEKLKYNSLKFDINEMAPFQVGENIFIRACRCDLGSWMKSSIGGSDLLIESLYNESYCTLNTVFSKCFKHPEGFMRVANFSEFVCNAQETIVCVDNESPIVNNQNPNIIKAVGIINENKLDEERKLITTLMAAALGGVFVMILLSLFMWFNRKGYQVSSCFFTSSIGCSLSSFVSRLMSSSHGMTRATSASSITRVSIHEYTEIWPQKLLSSAGDLEETYVCEDKATQTLPEELTQELLQNLREKLDDPENYGEARNMIEHLYDLIKVEENCNNNVLGEEFVDMNFAIDEDLMGNVYDVIKPGKQRVRRYDRSFKTLAHKGTRAPSPDKLSPQSFTTSSFSNSSLKLSPLSTLSTTRPSISDYMEPTDRQSYAYYELPYDQCGPSKSSQVQLRDRGENITLADYEDPRDAKIPIYSELSNVSVVSGRPLPVTPPLKNQITSNKDLGNSRTES